MPRALASALLEVSWKLRLILKKKYCRFPKSLCVYIGVTMRNVDYWEWVFFFISRGWNIKDISRYIKKYHVRVGV